MSALDSSETRDEDYFAILASTTLGLVDQGLETLTDEDLLETVTWMIDNGAFNAPNRVRVHFGNDRALFERLIARADSGEPHAFNLYYLDKARKKMAELSMT